MVSRIVLSDDGTTLKARKAYERAEFLASTDERFRPVYLSNAPDGTMYVVDLYRGILEHRNSLTVYLRSQITSRHLEEPTNLGRIYRVVHETTARDSSTDLSKASAAQLVARSRIRTAGGVTRRSDCWWSEDNSFLQTQCEP